MPTGKDKRKYPRYETEVKIYFYLSYDIRTKVEFRVLNNGVSKKYKAHSRNISAEGLCFRSEKKLTKGDILCLEVYLPKQKNPIAMEGVVRWSDPIPSKSKRKIFETGIRLTVVNGEDVVKSIYHDTDNKVVWSIVLESVLGNFRIFGQKRHGKPAK